MLNTNALFGNRWLLASVLLLLPFMLQPFGNAWIRIADMSLLYVLLALGLNIVVGYAGLLDLGYVAFFAVGAYLFGLLASPHLTDAFPWIATMFSNGLHLSLWMVLPMAAGVAALFGIVLGAPTLKLRGDYLAIVTLGFGEIIRVFLNNLDQPVNITNGPKGIGSIDAFQETGFGFYGDPFCHLVLLLVSLAGSCQRRGVPSFRKLTHRSRLDGDSRR
jgi:branched-chain amino acid transport system permease protein